MQNKKIEMVARALFEHEQSSRFVQITNEALYGQREVTWEFINSQSVVPMCADKYRGQAQAAIKACEKWDKENQTHHSRIDTSINFNREK